MAVIGKRGRKATTSRRRKPSASKKRKAKVSASPTTVKIGGQKFSKASCHSKKTDAKKRAESVRSNGSRARVIKNGKAYCVYTGGKRKSPSRSRRAA
ncbi:MAG: hypothetical protein R3A50_04790 [Saprospiraceae bacterium]